MKTVGEVLREARENKSLTIKQVSNATKIREGLVEALETGDYTVFSSEMHLKSFLRSYASFLGINEEKALALYRRDKQQATLEKGKKGADKEPLFQKAFFNVSKLVNPKTIISVIGSLLIIGVIYFFFIQIQAFYQPPILEITSPQANSIVTEANVTIEGFTGDPSVKVLVDGNEANYVDTFGNFKVNVKFNEPGLKRFQIIARNQVNKETSAQLELNYQPQETASEVTPTPAPSPDSFTLTLKNTGNFPATYTAKIDNNSEYETVTVDTNEEQDIVFKQRLELTDYDEELLEIYLPGAEKPTSTIDSTTFSIIIEHGILIVKEESQEESNIP